MNKIIVIGCPGSGKSTFSRALHEITGIPLYYLDMMHWNADRTYGTREELIANQQQIFPAPGGSLTATMEAPWSFGWKPVIP